MWIFTPTSFLSIVAHDEKPNVLMVRARVKGDIERVFPSARVQATPSSDYPYRAEVSRKTVASTISKELLALNYHNVKSAIPKDQPLRHLAMMDVWDRMRNFARGLRNRNSY